jgi:hypothetical protein
MSSVCYIRTRKDRTRDGYYLSSYIYSVLAVVAATWLVQGQLPTKEKLIWRTCYYFSSGSVAALFLILTTMVLSISSVYKNSYFKCFKNVLKRYNSRLLLECYFVLQPDYILLWGVGGKGGRLYWVTGHTLTLSTKTQ